MSTFSAVVTAHGRSPHPILGNLLYQTRKPDEILCLVSDFPVGDLQEDFATVKFFQEENKNDWGHDKRAKGLSLSTGDFVGFFNADDSYEMHYIHRMMRTAETLEADVVFCGWNTLPGCHFGLRSSTSGNFIVNRGVALEAGYDDRVYEADGLLIERINRVTDKIQKVPEILYYHNVPPTTAQAV